MRLTQLIGRRFKETPGEAVLISHALLLRGGYIRQVANGIYSLLPLGLKVIQKIETIIREEMNSIGGQEVLMPVVLPRELWDESGRYESIGSELLRFKDRTDHEMILAMTHEEGAVQLTRNEVNSYRSYPFMIYQIQTKFRDEPRSRGGLIRVREFTMKDAYSFHVDNEDLQRQYNECADAYSRIFSRAGIPEVVKVESDTGMMGGRVAHEFMLLTDGGEDTIVKCNKCNYISNLESATTSYSSNKETQEQLKKVHTPDKTTIAEISNLLNVKEDKIAKVVFYERDVDGSPVMVLIRGDIAVNEMKLIKYLGCTSEAATETTMCSCGVVPGYASPLGAQRCRILVDHSIAASSNLVCGANEADYHYLNFNLERDVQTYELVDVALVKEDDNCSKCDGSLTFKRGIEVGNIFQLGTKYTQSMNMRYLDSEGNDNVPIMGCYGIGVGRLMASIVEVCHDNAGPIWPVSVAPYMVHIIAIGLTDEEKSTFSTQAYTILQKMGIDVIYDDRNERAGVQFADADLIGAPLRLIFSKRNMPDLKVEWKNRTGLKKGMVDLSLLPEFVKKYFE